MNRETYFGAQKFANKWSIGLAVSSSVVIIGLFGWGWSDSWRLVIRGVAILMPDTALALVGAIVILFTLGLSGASTSSEWGT